MAEHGAFELGTATGDDYADRQRTYRGFLRLTKYGLAAAVVVLALMAIFLT